VNITFLPPLPRIILLMDLREYIQLPHKMAMPKLPKYVIPRNIMIVQWLTNSNVCGSNPIFKSFFTQINLFVPNFILVVFGDGSISHWHRNTSSEQPETKLSNCKNVEKFVELRVFVRVDNRISDHFSVHIPYIFGARLSRSTECFNMGIVTYSTKSGNSCRNRFSDVEQS